MTGIGIILPLSNETTSLLRSSLIIPNLPSILIELIQNSIDANSNNITLTLDLDRWSIKCEDDGFGFKKEELTQVGKERYWTSKLNVEQQEEDVDEIEIGKIGLSKVNTFGFRGEALASLADIGILEILTKSNRNVNEIGDVETYSILIRGGEKLFDGISNTKRNSFGTSVWVRDIFYKWPVRRKPLSKPSTRLALISSFRTALCNLSLVHPNISFTLIDATTTNTTNNNSSIPKRLLQVSKSGDGFLGRWKQIWGKAGVEKVEVYDKSQEIEVSTGQKENFVLEGFFSLTASHSKSSQYIYVNSRPLAPCHLHKLVNFLFSQSSFSKYSPSLLIDSTSTLTNKNQTQLDTNSTKATRKSPKKVSERFPIFVMNLRAPAGMIDVTLEPEKKRIEFEDSEKVYKFVEEVVKFFLIKNGFSSVASKEVGETPSQSLFTQKILPFSSVESPSRKQTSTPVPSNPIISNPIVQPKEIYVHPQLYESDTSNHTPFSTDTPIRWIDPTTKQTFLIDPRTGNSWRPALNEASLAQMKVREEMGEASCCSGGGVEKERGRINLVDRSRLRKRGREEVIEGDEALENIASTVPDWITKTLKNWENPIFESCSSLVPILPPVSIENINSTTSANNLNQSTILFKSIKPSTHSEKKMKSFFKNNLNSTSAIGSLLEDVRGLGQKFTKEDLRNAKWLAQVDKKFLLVKIKTSTASSQNDDQNSNVQETLIMVDQHAASERVRVEKYLNDYCGSVARGEKVKLFTFEEPKGLILSKEEVVQLRDNGAKEECDKWGIVIDLEMEIDVGERADYIQVKLVSIPLVISDRLKLEPRLQQELVRSFLAQLVEENGRGRGKKNLKVLEGESSWMSVMRNCPLVILDLINSKACRGAVMFNDALTPLQCTTLLSQLSNTIYPFQCAHGRPSLVPLVNLVNSNSSTRKNSAVGEKVIEWSRLKK